MPDDVAVDGELSPENLARAQQAAAALDSYAARVAKMQECGFDCRAEEAYRLALKDRFDRLLRTYGRERRRA